MIISKIYKQLLGYVELIVGTKLYVTRFCKDINRLTLQCNRIKIYKIRFKKNQMLRERNTTLLPIIHIGLQRNRILS